MQWERVVDKCDLSDTATQAFVRLYGDGEGATELAEVAQEEVGITGTRIRSGRLETDPNYNYRPFYVRGLSGNWGLYEEHYRGEPTVADSVNSLREGLVSGTYEVQPPADLDPSREQEVQAFCDWCNERLADINGGWSRFIEHAATSLIFGFAVFEVVWAHDGDQRWYPKKLAFREPSTIDRWIMDERCDELLGVRFDTGGWGAMRYILPAQGPSLLDHRVLLISLNRRGNDFEGIAPMRPAMHWIKYKHLLAQIKALAAEKYGIPIPVFGPSQDSKLMELIGMSVEDKANDIGAALRTIWGAIRAYEGASIERPIGWEIEYLAPPNTMPELQDQINYCDEMIARMFSNEGSMLGLRTSVGSYALAEVQERSALPSIPYYARKIAEPVEQLIRLMGLAQGIPEARRCKLAFRLDSLSDNGRWIDDFVKVADILPTLPEVVRTVVLEKFNLPANAFDVQPEEQPQTSSPEEQPQVGLAPTEEE